MIHNDLATKYAGAPGKIMSKKQVLEEELSSQMSEYR